LLKKLTFVNGSGFAMTPSVFKVLRKKEKFIMETERWEIDSSHSGIHFSVRHMVIAKVRGQFGRWSGTILIPGGNIARATAKVLIDASSIDTGVAERDTHLKSADFFDVAVFPEITFEATHVEAKDSENFSLSGELTMHGVTRQIVLDVECTGKARDPWGNERSGFSGKTSINRKDFGLNWNQVLETGGVLVGERVEVEFDIEAVRQQISKSAATK
jgi:polyisoprenoid-binding protein YceI